MIPGPTVPASPPLRLQTEEGPAHTPAADVGIGNSVRCFYSSSPAATQALAAALAPLLPSGCLLRLEGDLGAGKTTWVQGLARGLGVVGPVQSPTFTLIREYVGAAAVGLAHMDFYRLAGAGQAVDLGLDAYLDGDDVLAVEWPDRAGDALPRTGMAINLAPPPDDARSVWPGETIKGTPGQLDDAQAEQPRLIRMTGLDEVGAAVLAALAPPAESGLHELPCPFAEVDPD